MRIIVNWQESHNSSTKINIVELTLTGGRTYRWYNNGYNDPPYTESQLSFYRFRAYLSDEYTQVQKWNYTIIYTNGTSKTGTSLYNPLLIEDPNFQIEEIIVDPYAEKAEVGSANFPVNNIKKITIDFPGADIPNKVLYPGQEVYYKGVPVGKLTVTAELYPGFVITEWIISGEKEEPWHWRENYTGIEYNYYGYGYIAIPRSAPGPTWALKTNDKTSDQDWIFQNTGIAATIEGKSLWRIAVYVKTLSPISISVSKYNSSASDGSPTVDFFISESGDYNSSSGEPTSHTYKATQRVSSSSLTVSYTPNKIGVHYFWIKPHNYDSYRYIQYGYSFSATQKGWKKNDPPTSISLPYNKILDFSNKSSYVQVYEIYTGSEGKASFFAKSSQNNVRGYLTKDLDWSSATGLPTNIIARNPNSYLGYCDFSYDVKENTTYYFWVSFIDPSDSGQINVKISAPVTPEWSMISEKRSRINPWKINNFQKYTLYCYEFTFPYEGDISVKIEGNNNMTSAAYITKQDYAYDKKEGIPLSEYLYYEAGTNQNYNIENFRVKKNQTYILWTKVLKNNNNGSFTIVITNPVPPSIIEGKSCYICTKETPPLSWEPGKMYYCNTEYGKGQGNKNYWTPIGFKYKDNDGWH